jgi:hypothetical protein
MQSSDVETVITVTRALLHVTIYRNVQIHAAKCTDVNN